MPSLLISLFLLLPLSFANFESLLIKKLDLDYNRPYGKGEVEKVSIGMSTLVEARDARAPYPIEVHRTESALLLSSQYLDFSWLNPISFFHNMQALLVKKGHVDAGFKTHTASAGHVTMRPEEQEGLFKLDGLDFKCAGFSEAKRLEDRLLDDCLQSLSLTVDKVDVPVDFFLVKILTRLPKIPAGADIPADDFKLTVDKGEFAMAVYLKYYVYAGLRAWGEAYYDDLQKTLIVRVDKIKFGYLPVTTLVMRELARQIKHERVKVEPPFIRISLQ